MLLNIVNVVWILSTSPILIFDFTLHCDFVIFEIKYFMNYCNFYL